MHIVLSIQNGSESEDTGESEIMGGCRLAYNMQRLFYRLTTIPFVLLTKECNFEGR